MAHRTRILTSAASVLSSGALALIPIGRMPAGARWGVGAVLSVVPAAVAAAVVHRRMHDSERTERVGAATVAGVALGAASLGAWEASARADRAIERVLVRRRVRRPRVVMAAGAAALTAVVEVLDAVSTRRDGAPRALEG